MKPNYVSIKVLLDRSGSMSTCKSDMEGGFNEFIKKQKESNTGELDVTLVKFDNCYEVEYRNLDIKNVPDLVLEPRGNTDLYGSLGRFIDDTGIELYAKPENERPSKVIFLIVTDGGHNTDQSIYTSEKVKSKIKEQREKYNWDFVFLGANIDTWAVSNALGIAADQTSSYVSRGRNTKRSVDYVWTDLSDKLYCVRTCVAEGNASTAGIKYTKEDQEKQEELVKSNN